MKKNASFLALLCATSFSVAKVTINYGMSTYQNKRPYQEDRFTHAHALVYGNDFFAVYDGHGGDKTSSYLQNNLHKYFTEYCNDKSTIHATFKRAFKKAEDYALENFDDGSTAVVGCVDNDNVLHCAWTGDSRLVVEKHGKVSFATEDHKPERKDERLRIINAGGSVKFLGVWRVNGLAVSRSIGDKSLKAQGKGQIIAVPEYVKIKLNEDNHFAIIASDGLWDVMSSEEAVAFVKERLKKSSDLNAIAHDLKNEAVNLDSGDNITICIVSFNELKEMPAPSRFTRFWNWLRGK